MLSPARECDRFVRNVLRISLIRPCLCRIGHSRPATLDRSCRSGLSGSAISDCPCRGGNTRSSLLGRPAIADRPYRIIHAGSAITDWPYWISHAGYTISNQPCRTGQIRTLRISWASQLIRTLWPIGMFLTIRPVPIAFDLLEIFRSSLGGCSEVARDSDATWLL